MANSLAKLLGDDVQRAIWIDGWDYCRRLFLDGQALDWNNRQAVDEFARKSDALIHSQVYSVPLGQFLEHALCNIPGLKAAMAQKSRTGYALKYLLRDEEVRRQIQQALKTIVEALPSKPVVLTVPAPRFCVQWAYQAAHGRSPEALSVDHADSASVYLSDFVSALGHTGIAGLLVEEQCPGDEAWQQEQEIYVPLRNVTQHQQWQLGLRLNYAASVQAPVEHFDFTLSRGELGGHWLDDGYWSGDQPANTRAVTYGLIPTGAEPETVLTQRKALGGYS